MESPQTQYARSGELFIAYQVAGDGPFDLVFVPGLISHAEVWWELRTGVAHFFRQLSSFSRLILFDKRGTGLSDRSGGVSAFEEQMDHVKAVMDAAGSARAALFGTADGGPLSCIFSATYPERTSALILYGAYAKRTWAPDYPWAPTADFHEKALEIYERKWGREPVGLGSVAPSLMDDERFRADYTRLQRFAASPGSAMAWYRLASQIDVREVLPAIRVPTLILHRTGDRAFEIENGRYLAQNIKDSKLVEMPGEDHSINVNPDPIIEEIQEFLTGSRRLTEPDRVLATVLFTDIVGSTEKAADMGDRRWRNLLDEHDAIARAEIERFRGTQVGKTLGDGILATFDGPARALRCASTIVNRVRPLGIQIRAGLHTGECEMRGDNVTGIAVNIGARVLDFAGPEEVLVTNTVKDLVIGTGIEFADRGSHVLKGVPGEWRLFQLVKEDSHAP